MTTAKFRIYVDYKTATRTIEKGGWSEAGPKTGTNRQEVIDLLLSEVGWLEDEDGTTYYDIESLAEVTGVSTDTIISDVLPKASYNGVEYYEAAKLTDLLVAPLEEKDAAKTSRILN